MCPAGWHVPAENDWTQLETFLGGSSVAGGKLKSIGSFGFGTGFWNSSNGSSTNLSGFSALPNGYRNLVNYEQMGGYATFWCVDEFLPGKGNHRIIGIDEFIFRDENFNYKSDGYSIRCIKD